jgi:hypothetical protein
MLISGYILMSHCYLTIPFYIQLVIDDTLISRHQENSERNQIVVPDDLSIYMQWPPSGGPYETDRMQQHPTVGSSSNHPTSGDLP